MSDNTISHYRIVEKLGEGGMGVVYRAEDTVLGRQVAVKLLHGSLATENEVRMRLLREARTAAALNHPNICTIHEVDEVGNEAAQFDAVLAKGIRPGTPFIVMELVRGRTLQAMLSESGALPLKNFLSLAVQIADGLAAAHARHIVHRDLKPSNVMVDSDGRAIILDFGLAKPLTVEFDQVSSWAETRSAELSRKGEVVGTVAYMAPEQALGKAIDSRSDIFTFGIILYEMATGVRPFQGETATSTIAKILEGEAQPMTGLRNAFPYELERIIRRCLQKNPNERYNDTRDLVADLKEARQTLASSGSTARATAVTQIESAPRSRRRVKATLGVVAAILAAAVFVTVPKLHRSPAAPPSHKQVTFLGDVSFPAISPDGKFLAYVTGVAGSDRRKLMVNDLSGSQPLQVFESERLSSPVWSNDGAELMVQATEAGVTSTTIVPRLGGPGRRLNVRLYKRAWAPDNKRFAGINQGQRWIRLVDTLTAAYDEIPLTGSFAFMMDVDWSPLGDSLLFVTLDEQERSSIWTIRVDGSSQQKLVEQDLPIDSARWSANGDFIYFLRGNNTKELLKIPVSPRSGKIAGSPEVLLAGLEAGEYFTVSRDGKQLAYTRRARSVNLWHVSAKSSTRAATSKQLTTGTTIDDSPSLSPDGTQLAFSRSAGQKSNIFVMPIDGGDPRQITFLNSMNAGPVWSPDGKAIAFGSTEGGKQHVWRISSNGGTPQPFEQTKISTNSFSIAWAPNGKILYHAPGNRNFHLFDPISGSQEPLIEDSSVGWMFEPHFSPDGSRVAVNWNNLVRLPGLWLIPVQNPNDTVMIATGNINRQGAVSQTQDASSLRGREVKVVAHIKTSVSGAENQGRCLLRVERPKGQRGFFDDMENRPIQSASWTEVEIAGKVDEDAERIVFGCFVKGVGQMWIDEVQLLQKNPGGQWQPLPIHNPGFEEADPRMKPADWDLPYSGYTFQVAESSPFKGKRSLLIRTAHVFGDFSLIGWSADGKYVYAVEGSGKQIVMIRADGEEIKPLIELPAGKGSAVTSAAITPDGQRVVYSIAHEQSDVWIVENFDSR